MSAPATETSFEESLVSYMLPDREALVLAVNKLLWEKGERKRPLKLRELKTNGYSGLRALLIFMSYRKGGIRKGRGVGAQFKGHWVSLRWTTASRGVGYTCTTWAALARLLNEPAYAESNHPEELAELVIDAVRELASLARPKI
jgi:hypothetical protein